MIFGQKFDDENDQSVVRIDHSNLSWLSDLNDFSYMYDPCTKALEYARPRRHRSPHSSIPYPTSRRWAKHKQQKAPGHDVGPNFHLLRLLVVSISFLSQLYIFEPRSASA